MPALSNANANAGSDDETAIKPKMLKKMAYFKHLQAALDEYDQAFLVNADNVGSKQMQEIRMTMRGKWYVALFGPVSKALSA